MITIEGLKFNYRKKPLLFDGLTTRFESGRIYGLLGRNGAGKTTLLKLISGLRFPTGGSVKLWDIESYKRLPQILERIFMVPEQFVLPSMKASSYAKIYGEFYSKFDYGLFNNLMEDFELSIDEKLTEMSYGKKKKFLIAFALSTGAEIILMDEPTNGLDIPSKVKFRQVIARNLTENRIFIISTHQVRDVEGLIDHLKFIDKGRIILDFPVDYLNERLRFERVEDLDGDELYAQKVFGGWHVIKPATSQDASILDLELLFTAAVSSGNKLLDFLNAKN